MRITPEQIVEMTRLRKIGYSYNHISISMGINIQAVIYHLNPHYKEFVKSSNRIRNREYYKNHKKKILEKARKYNKVYMKNRYHNDAEFRKRHIELVKKRKIQKRLEKNE